MRKRPKPAERPVARAGHLKNLLHVVPPIGWAVNPYYRAGRKVTETDSELITCRRLLIGPPAVRISLEFAVKIYSTCHAI